MRDNNTTEVPLVLLWTMKLLPTHLNVSNGMDGYDMMACFG